MATLAEALEQLDAHGGLQRAFCSRDISLWVGVGLSLRALSDLGDVIERVISWLQEKARKDGWPAESEYSQALDTVRQFDVGLIPSDRNLVLLPLQEWSDLPTALRRLLQERYSQVLGAIDLSISEDLRTDVLDIPGTYADPHTNPTSEHRLLALLVSEGLVGRVISTNWDDLIEKACAATHGLSPVIIAGPQDVPGSLDPPFLAKIHGCARKAREDPAYANGLVVTATQIGEWPNKPENQGLRTIVDSVIRNGNCCFVGLSAQDFNIQQAHFAAAMSSDPLPADRLPTFAETDVQAGQQQVLAAMSSAAGGEMARLVERATLGIRANDVLGAAYFHGVFAKLKVIAERMPRSEERVYGAFVTEGLATTMSQLTDWLDGLADDRRWDSLAFEVSRWLAAVLAIYRDATPLPDDLAYAPLTSANVPATVDDPNLPMASLHRLLWALLAVASLARDNDVTLRFPSDPQHGQVSIGPAPIATRVFVVHRNAGGAAALNEQGLLDGDTPALIVNADSSTPKKRTNSPTPVFPGRVERLSQLYLDDFVSDPDDMMALNAELLTAMPIGG